MDDGRRAGYGQSSAWSRRIGAGLAAAICCLLMLAALDANLAGILRSTPTIEVSTFRLLPTSSPAAAPSVQRRSRTGEASRSSSQPVRAAETAPTDEKGETVASPLSLPAPTVPTVAALSANRQPKTEPDTPPQQAHDDDTKGTALAAYQRQLWARISARKPAGIHLAGVATLRFTVGDDGALVAVELVASSGNAALDRLALRTVRNAAPFPPPPDVERDQLVFTIPFSFH